MLVSMSFSSLPLSWEHSILNRLIKKTLLVHFASHVEHVDDTCLGLVTCLSFSLLTFPGLSEYTGDIIFYSSAFLSVFAIVPSSKSNSLTADLTSLPSWR